MKAFVIKRNDGKYWQWLFNHEPDWEDKLYNGFMHYSKEDAEKRIIQWQLKDCEVVEITIAEGDLEQEIDLLKSIVKLDHPEIEKVKHFESGLMFILDKCVESKAQENELLKKALELACKKFIRDEVGMLTDTELYDYFIEQAKESSK